MTRYYMLDTNMMSYLMKGKSPAARTRLEQLNKDEIGCISSITEGELRFGFAKRGIGPALLSLYEELLGVVQVLPWGSEQASAYGKLRDHQEASGKPLAPLDTLIAAHAASIGAVLVTRDGAFRQIDGLAGVENWATDL